MRQLYFLDIGKNQLSGALSARFATGATNLRHLHMDNNAFTGQLPGSYFEAGNGGPAGGGLLVLTAHNNMLSGAVPAVASESFGKYLLHFVLTVEMLNDSSLTYGANIVDGFRHYCTASCSPLDALREWLYWGVGQQYL